QSNENPGGWKLLNPQPSASTAQDIFFINSQTGFILNDNQIIGTTDGGNRWNVIMNITSGKRMAFKENIGYIIGNGGAIYKSTPMGGGWNKLKVSFTDQLNAISLISKDTVLITSDNKLFVSLDGGQSWKSSDVTNANIEDSYFTSSKVGHVACSNGTILKTIDGGVNWYITSSVSYFPADINRIYFIDSTTGFASRGHNDILKTTDGGETWKNIKNTSDKIYSYYFLDKQNGFIAGDHGVIFKTTNGGATWDWIGFQNGRYAGTTIYSLCFIDRMTGYAVGIGGRIMKTVDGGKTWKPYSITYNTIKQLKFITDQTAYGLAGNTFFKTIDGGKSWINMGAPAVNGNTVQFDFVNENIGYCIAGGKIGTSADVSMVYKTTDGGKTWVATNNGLGILSDDLYTIDFADQLTGYVSGGYDYMGSTFKTEDGGNTWQKVNSISFTQIQFVNTQVGYARDVYKRIYKTIDAGKSWKITLESNEQLQSIQFVNEKIGYCVGNNASGFKTIDGGATWEKMELPYGDYINVRFYNANVGYASEDYGQTYQTSDGGISWELLNKPYSVSSIELFGKKIFAYGNGGVILENTISYEPVSIMVNVASAITNNSVTLTSSVASNEGTIRNIKFEYGEYYFNNSISVMPDSVLSNNTSNFSIELKDLKANTTYIYRLIASCNGIDYSSDVLEFKTMPDFQITMNYVYGLTSNEADLSATLISNKGVISNIEFQYGTNNTYNLNIEASPNSVAGETTQEVKAHLTQLIPQTRYYARIKAVYNDSVIYSPAINFVTSAEDSMQLYNPNIIGNNVTVLATISAYKDTIRHVVMEYGTTREYKRHVVFSPDQINKHSFEYVTAQLTGLDSDSVYYYRIKADMGDETIYSIENVLRLTGGVIIVPTEVQKLSDSSILLSGLINTNGKFVNNIQFEYGITKEMGNSVNSLPGYSYNNRTMVIQATLNGLLPDTEYYFRIKGTDGLVIYYSEEFTYYTGPTSIKDIDKGSERVVVYPNPAHEYVVVKSPYAVKKIELMDVNSRILEEKTNDHLLNISSYPNGLYFVKVYTDKGLEIKKIIKD
ncbi:MAG TPA: YCF48-related protein, partial [Prolixibacteraceae bacterium]|nr:YCF48-related protein [Prolixibacteraceae bacterium]